MKKVMISTLAIFSISSIAFASINNLETKIKELYSLHALECAPDEIGKAEAYIEAVKGLKIDENGKSKVVKVSKIDKLIYENKAKVYIAKAEKKIFSDIDNDGEPCYKEIEKGTNPYISDKKYVKVRKKSEESAKKEVAKKEETKKEANKEAKTEKKPSYEPLKTHARIHFELNSATVKREYLPYLNVISRYLKTHKNLKVKIIGYTDNLGSKEYNDKLALKRAKAVKKYLVNMGINPNRIEIVGKGKANYLFDNKTDLNRFTNRRAEFFIMDTK